MFNSKISSLENYLAQIARELRDLPARARADELREIEAHLSAMIEARGDVAGVLAQFGQPRKVGRDLRRAWERKQPEAWWRAAISPLAGVTFFALFSLMFQVLIGLLSSAQLETLIASIPLSLLGLGIYLPLGGGLLTTGFVMGFISPKRGNLVFLSLLAIFSAIAVWEKDITLAAFTDAVLFSSYQTKP